MSEIQKKIKSLFLNDRFIYSVILINSITIFLLEFDVGGMIIGWIDTLCIIIFLLEMYVKCSKYGWPGYWKEGWNRFDGTLALLSIPSLVLFFLPTLSLSASSLLSLRIIRILRFGKIVELFPSYFSKIAKNSKLAIKNTIPVLLCFVLVIISFSLISCAIFKQLSPVYFGTPIDAFYSVFRLCTVEGWYEIPDSLSSTLDTETLFLVRIYFITILVLGGIIGLSLVNSIFVDAMVSDNNEDLKREIEKLNKKIDIQNKRIEILIKRMDNNKRKALN